MSADMTALICTFARAYHAKSPGTKVFYDDLAARLLGREDYLRIANCMAEGIRFFCPNFEGNQEEALRYAAERQLCPTPLGRAAFAEEALHAAVESGVTQYALLGAGYDTFACRMPEWANSLRIFEIDLPEVQADKQARIARAGLNPSSGLRYIAADLCMPGWESKLYGCGGYDKGQRCFFSLLGLSYYLPKQAFSALLQTLFRISRQGSLLAFDYPDAQHAGAQAEKLTALAKSAGTAMVSAYSFEEMKSMLRKNGFRPCMHLTPREITARYFSIYRAEHPGTMLHAMEGVNFCLAERV